MSIYGEARVARPDPNHKTPMLDDAAREWVEENAKIKYPYSSEKTIIFAAINGVDVTSCFK